MLDLREIQLLDNNFELTETIAQNEELAKDNKHLLYISIAGGLLIIGLSIYLAKKHKDDKFENWSNKNLRSPIKYF